MVKVNDCDRMTYTLYGFPLAVQIWTYEAIPELGARFSSKTCDDVPRMLRWSGMKQPHSRTYSDFFEKTNVHLWATLRATAAEELQPYFVDLVPLEDAADPILDDLVAQSIEIQACPVDDDVIRNDDNNHRPNKSQRGNKGGPRHRGLHLVEGREEEYGDPIVERHVSLNEIRVILNEQREAFESKMGDLRKEINTRFASLQNDLGGHVCGLRNHVTDEMNVLRRRFDEVATEIGQHNVGAEYGGFGHDDRSGDEPRHDVFTPNIFADRQDVGEATEPVVCNIPDVSITSGGGVGVLGSIYVACDIVKEAPAVVPTVGVTIDDQLVHDSIVSGPSMAADPPTRRPRSLRLKKASVNTKTPYTRSGRNRGKRDA
ncbi:Hypothetical predicted protein [Olea europaea subsp. europaea]|uniref:Uncharacterized protein n=1 Tax=Olea europaea subsp. europaea TaxID=158383 RepID=A0A8S0U3P1_OLEEU|nr:Hypothetical predicted protein [Olea europaea subsp. europaea]